MALENKRRSEIIKKQAALRKEETKPSKLETIKSTLAHCRKEFFHVKLFLKRSKKPGKGEYLHMLASHTKGVLMLGFLGYIITFIHIPINNILFGIKK
ncbi:protein transport protein SEC61 subunit gamma [Nematocida minor]|uniref:protein transport protein SEC61 subunit gamma n=1 Tax=Nematocida minor TaxID=1912983 RepID=UPI002220735C|nr:protein transport protein SEC61 subunit gamma [Nematocida minor]KAI5192239.1 protein transport protein SEC61 subunit gamma [Nematocida minor]